MPQPTVYLAGPSVFHPEWRQLADTYKRLGGEHGLRVLYPMDNEADLSSLSPAEAGLLIGRLNDEMLRGADLCIADLSPFRGVSADPGTVLEVGLAVGLGRPVYAYSTSSLNLKERVIASGILRSEAPALAVEDFHHPDNLMLPWAVRDAGGEDIERPSATCLPAWDVSPLQTLMARIAPRIAALRSAKAAVHRAFGPAPKVVHAFLHEAQAAFSGRSLAAAAMLWPDKVDETISIWDAAKRPRGRTQPAAPLGAVRYGCFCDLSACKPGTEPDECVMDDGRYQDCIHAHPGARKEACEFWKPWTPETLAAFWKEVETETDHG